MALIRRRLQAFYDQQEDDLRKIVAALITDRIICSTLQCRVLWVQNHYYRILGRPGMEKKFDSFFGSHFIAPLKRFS